MATQQELEDTFAGKRKVTPEEIRKTQEQMRQWGSPFAVLASLAGVKHCPECYGILEYGDGGETPPVYCSRCGKGWNEVPPQKGVADGIAQEEDCPGIR